MDQAPKSIALLIDPEQVDGIIRDLIACKELNAASVIIMVTPYDGDRENLDNKTLPRRQPDIIAHDTVYTLGLSMPVEEIIAGLDAGDHS